MGRGWCESLEGHSDYANRLPRGRTYVRNGSVIDLDIARGRIDALVSGSELYTVRADISELKPVHWKQLKCECSASIDSLLDLLAGRFSDGVMRTLTDPQRGLFPQPKEIKMSCSCPDWAVLCKHVAAVLYAIGARLDREPELLFLLRGVDHTELVSQAVSSENLTGALSGSGEALAQEDLGAIFGIELDTGVATGEKAKGGRRKTSAKRSATTATRSRSKKAVEQAAVVIEKPAGKKVRSAKTTVTSPAKRNVSARSKAAVPAEAKAPEKIKPAKRSRVAASVAK